MKIAQECDTDEGNFLIVDSREIICMINPEGTCKLIREHGLRMRQGYGLVNIL